MLELIMIKNGPKLEMHNISSNRYLYHDGEVNPITRPGGEWVVEEVRTATLDTGVPYQVRIEICRTSDRREAINKFMESEKCQDEKIT